MPEPQIALKVALLGPAAITDTFTRTVSNGWGTATTGGTWTVSGGAAADFAVATGTGRHSHPSINTLRSILINYTVPDLEVVLDTYPAVTPAGAAVVTGVLARRSGANYYWLRTEYNVGGTIMLKVSKQAGTYSELAALDGVPGLTYTAGVPLRTRVQVVGDRLRMRAWPAAGTEPTDWHVEVTDPAPLTATAQVGVQTWVVGGNTNPLPVVVHVDNVTVTPYWTDLAGRLLYGDGGGPLTVDVGRQTELQEVEPTRIAAVLKNGDGALNPRNPTSPYYGTWEQGRQLRVTETVGGQEIDLATGFLEIPDVQVNSPNVDQPCSISAVDRLGRLAGAAPYEGTLAEHVRNYGGRLVEWYPLSESASNGEYMSAATDGITQRSISGYGTQVPIEAEPDDLIKPASIPGPAGDDQSYALWAPVGGDVSLSEFADAHLTAPASITAGPTDTIAVSAWVNFQEYQMAAGAVEPQGWLIHLSSPTAYLSLLKDFISGTTFYNGTRLYHSVAGTVTYLNAGRPYELNAWRLVTARYDLKSGLYEFFVGSDAVASATVTPPGTALTFTELSIGLGWSGGIAHVQVRVGPAATTMTRAMHQAQNAHGYRGLQRQTVAERVATLAGYAGVPASELDLPAEASTPMQAAKLAGANPAAAMQEAATTGQDTLMTTPQGRITLVPRGRRYNQPVTLAIPFGWLSRGGIRYRPDKPVTDTAASITGGGTARRVSEPLRARHGVSGRTVTLDTAVDADAANWAAWTLAAFGQPRTRCPLVRLDMLKRTAAERQALLALKVGDRIQLTGMPANSPEDVPHLIVQGIRHIIGPHRRRLLELNTSPLLGPTPGAPPACPVVGDLVANTAIVAY